ncbi:MAG: nucleotidyl transferase AbiEii/AbiGii toxin family protein [Alphaproteobacteria bacterium]|nr:nucleotidyl transferase AbiEii/AbiGii toxin family protein [Alphaproteobacteria bacterium]
MFQLNTGILPPAQADLWPLLSSLPAHVVLYGGTAIALHLGHRESVDFDFFSSQPLDRTAKETLLGLPCLSGLEILQDDIDTLVFSIRRLGQPVRLAFFGAVTCGRIGTPLVPHGGGPRVASLIDLFAHKLKVIHDRAEGKDYQDITAILTKGQLGLDQGMAAAEALFREHFSIAATLKALVYFDDLNESWRVGEESKNILLQAIKALPEEWPAATRAAETIV